MEGRVFELKSKSKQVVGRQAGEGRTCQAMGAMQKEKAWKTPWNTEYMVEMVGECNWMGWPSLHTIPHIQLNLTDKEDEERLMNDAGDTG